MPSNPQLQKLPVMEPMWAWGGWTHLVVVSGRNLGKSHQAAKWAIHSCVNIPGTRILVTRQFYDSLNESIYTTIKGYLNRITQANPRMAAYYRFSNSVKDCWIKFSNGSEMLFYGVDRHPESIKGIDDIDILISDEVQTYTQTPMDILIDTVIRNSGIRCLWLGNRRNRTDTWEKQLIEPGLAGDEDIHVIQADYRQNIFIHNDKGEPDRERLPGLWHRIDRMRRTDPDRYRHVYLGHFDTVSDAVIFKRITLLDEAQTRAFEQAVPADATWLYGLDWSMGGADPHCLTEIAVWEDNLYASREVALYGEDTNTGRFPALLAEGMAAQGLPDIQNRTVVCDTAPILIQHLKDHGWTSLVQVKKTKEMRIRSYRAMGAMRMTFSHRCQGGYAEAEAKMFEVSKEDGRPKSPPAIPDGDDHRLDSYSYAISRNRQQGGAVAAHMEYED